MSDRHIRRSGDDYGSAFLELLPQGPAWPRSPESILDLTCRGLSDYWGTVDARAADLLERESDPRQTIELLPDWERNWGLPDPCYKEPLTVAERQHALVMRMTMLGAQSREFFIGVADSIGYKITIHEYRVWIVGLDRCGDNRVYGKTPLPMYNEWGNQILNARGVPISDGELSAWPNYGLGPPTNRFYWTVHVDRAKLIWFRCSSGQCGVDPHLRIGLADDLECLLNRWKPAHTKIIFDYSGLAPPAGQLIWFRVSVSHVGVDPLLRIIIPGIESPGAPTGVGKDIFVSNVETATAVDTPSVASIVTSVAETAHASATQDATVVARAAKTTKVAGLGPISVSAMTGGRRLRSGTVVGGG
jgi:uncharacterized protein YmfQ (DUF2313 family)